MNLRIVAEVRAFRKHLPGESVDQLWYNVEDLISFPLKRRRGVAVAAIEISPGKPGWLVVRFEYDAAIKVLTGHQWKAEGESWTVADTPVNRGRLADLAAHLPRVELDFISVKVKAGDASPSRKPRSPYVAGMSTPVTRNPPHPLIKQVDDKLVLRRLATSPQWRWGEFRRCSHESKGRRKMDSTQENQILKIADTYIHAFETSDADLLESLFWIDDPRFSEIENDRPKPFGRETFLAISNWIRDHGGVGGKMRFYETAVHFLSPEVAYSTSMRDEFEGEEPIPSRVTLVFLRKDDEWKIIHGHFSCLPQ